MFPIHDENRPASRPYVNYTLLLVNILVFMYFLVQGNLDWGIYTLGTTPSDILNGTNLWTLLTSMFMHADILHIFGNMLFLWVFGDNIEDALGHVKYFIFYLAGGLAASFTHIASLWIALPALGFAGLTIPAVGASGAISAVLGAYIYLYPKARIRTIIFLFYIAQVVVVPAVYYLGFWFFYQLLMGFFYLMVPSGVAFWAHIGGFAAGFIIVVISGIKKKLPRTPNIRRKPTQPFFSDRRVRTPFIDVMTKGDNVKIIAELPGVEQEDIEIRVSPMEAEISAERGSVRYHKIIFLPLNVDPKVREMKFNNGVLSFSLKGR